MILREISLSEARRNLSALLHEIEADPSTGYRILVRRRVVAELRSPALARRRNAGAVLLKLAREMERLCAPAEGETDEVNSTNYKAYLYGNGPFAGTGRRR